MIVLAIDQGTSATKALVVDERGVVIGAAERDVAVDARSDGAVETDPEGLWRSVVDAGRAALDGAGRPRVDAIGLANQGETVLAWDQATTAPLTSAIVWQDRRAAPLCERLAADGWDARLRALTGLELDPYFSAPKLAWLRASLTRDGVAGTTDTWLLQRLTGELVTDTATASRSLLLDLDTARWSAEACAAFAIDPATLPRIVGNAEPIGATDVFSPGLGVPLTGTCVDQQAALFAQRCTEPGDTKCTYGTGAFLLTQTGTVARRSTNGLVACVAWQLADGVHYCLDGQVYTVGAAVDWLRTVGLIEHARDLDGVGAQVADTGGVVFVAGLAGLAAPFWRPGAHGAFTGLTLATTRAHLVRAAVEGIAAQVAWLARAAAADMGAPLTCLRVDGGLTRSRLLLQLQADLAQVPIEVHDSPHATALGVAAFARIGAGGAGDAATAFGEGVDTRPTTVIEPAIGRAEAEARLDAWRTAAEGTAEL